MVGDGGGVSGKGHAPSRPPAVVCEPSSSAEIKKPNTSSAPDQVLATPPKGLSIGFRKTSPSTNRCSGLGAVATGRFFKSCCKNQEY